MTDTDRLDFLEAETQRGACPCLIYDDNGHWTVAYEGTQQVPEGDGPQDFTATIWVLAQDWRGSIREAIDAAMEWSKP